VKNTGFNDILQRCFPCNDMWLGPCQLRAAMLADEVLDDLGPTLCDYNENEVFEKTVQVVVNNSHVAIWKLQLEYRCKG
jgi:hypothetical protein